MVRSAGSLVQLVAKEGDKATLQMPSGEVRTVPISCYRDDRPVSAISIIRMSFWAKPARRAGAAVVRRCAVSP